MGRLAEGRGSQKTCLYGKSTHAAAAWHARKFTGMLSSRKDKIDYEVILKTQQVLRIFLSL